MTRLTPDAWIRLMDARVKEALDAARFRPIELKTWPEPFRAVLSRRKVHEVRVFDRPFVDGGLLRLREWEPETQRYTGREALAIVTYITSPGTFGLPANVGVMSIELLASGEREGEVSGG